MTGLDARAAAALEETMAAHVAGGGVDGLVWAVARGDEELVQWAGSRVAGADRPVRRDSIFRISSMTKPIAAAATLTFVDDGTMGLDDPIDRWIPELADRRVLRRAEGPLDDTVPARRAITVEDLLTFRLGWGMDFDFRRPQPVLAAAAELGLGGGPPAPQVPPPVDEWVRRLATLPLSYQPGERWLYHVGADVTGVLLARVAGQALEDVLRERIFEPLGMADTGFHVPAPAVDRFGACYAIDPATGAASTYDDVDGQWSRAPAFPSGGAGLVSTIDDYLAFAGMIAAGGSHRGRQVLSQDVVTVMTTNQLTADQLAASAPDPDGHVGWGYGLGVRVAPGGAFAERVGSYGWDGGLGSVWRTDPTRRLTIVLLTTQAWTSPEPPRVCWDLIAGACALADAG